MGIPGYKHYAPNGAAFLTFANTTWFQAADMGGLTKIFELPRPSGHGLIAKKKGALALIGIKRAAPTPKGSLWDGALISKKLLSTNITLLTELYF